MAAEFKIGRLRFNWAGTWTPATFYNRDAVVSYQGKTYACLIPNTSSSNFYTDFNNGAWSLVLDGKTFLGPWATGTFYSLGNIVIFGGKSYYCTTAHTSSMFATDATNWSEYSEFVGWHTAWQPNTAYGLNDVVKYGGIVYKCINNHTSALSASLGLEANQSSWTTLFTGIEYNGTWTSAVRYKTNDLVKYGADVWISLSGHTSTTTFDPTKWATWLPGYEFAGAWNVATTYQPGDTVEYGGYQYSNNTVNNIGNVPSTDSVDWTLMNSSYEWKSAWNVAVAYKIGDVVNKNGMLYTAKVDNIGQDPTISSLTTTYTATGSSGTTVKVASTTNITIGMTIIGAGFQGQYVTAVVNSQTLTVSSAPFGPLTDAQTLNFVGINYVYWSIMVPGTFWKKIWQNGANYSVGDLVVWSNGTYVCIQTHTAVATGGQVPSGNRPDLDTSNTYWVSYIPHSRLNAMNTYGDMETYGSTVVSGVTTYTGRQAVPIGTSQYVLRNTGGVPTWTKIMVVPQVYYVSSTTGSDRPDYGTTWDQPWKTIKYATTILGAGTTNLNAVANLTNNKTWITTEMIQWTNYQINTPSAPYYGLFAGYSLNSTKSVRDAGYIIDAIAYDMSRGGNSQTVAAALSYFAFGSTNTFFNTAVAADVPYYLPMLTQLGVLINNAITNTAPAQSYQTLNGITLPVLQNTSGSAPENLSPALASSLLAIITSALTTQSTSLVPQPNSGITYTLNVKTGTYLESLPIIVPENTAINGDELRGVTIEPAVSITTTCTATNSTTNLFTVTSTTGLLDQMPVQFVDPTVTTTFAYVSPFTSITAGNTYYVVGSTITSTQFAVTTATGTYSQVLTTNVSSAGSNAEFNATPTAAGTYNVSLYYGGTGYAFNDIIKILGTSVGGTSPANDITIRITGVNNVTTAITTFTVTSSSTIYPLTATATGAMTMYAGDCLKDMFRMRNGSGLRNCTLLGLQGSLSAPDTYFIQRPTGPSYACLDPGSGPNDTTVWIFRRSPYVQNVTAFGNGCTALKIDGTLHNGGNKSIVANDFTHIINDGIGVWCTGPSALTEVVSVFSYYGYTGYFADAGGRIRATNGNSSYGTYGVISSGYDVTEVPASGIIFNQSSQVQATVQSAFGVNSQLLRINYANAGSGYNSTTYNYLNFSNNFLGVSWSNDSNVTFSKVNQAPTGIVEAWTFTGTGSANSSYVYQNLLVPTAGATYTAVVPSNLSGSGFGATFNITVTSTAYTITVNNPGSGYAVSNQLIVSGAVLGGTTPANDCIITVTGTSGPGTISNATPSGTVPANSALNYTFSVYVKQGTASSVDLQAVFSGSSTVTSGVSFNFTTGVVTPYNVTAGFVPVNYGALNQQISSTSPTAGWYRLWFSANDTTGLNNSIQFRIYPKGLNGTANTYNLIYGSQVELSKSTYAPSFYLENATTNKYVAYANYNITGAGTGAQAIGNEIRSNGIFQTRVISDSAGFIGGAGYLTASNNAQGGTSTYVTLAQSDNNTNANYTGMRVFINSGTGAGQYGYISYYDTGSKNVYVLQESFPPLSVTATTTGTNLFTLGGSGSTSTLYQGMPVQFIPTYYTTSITSTSLATATVTASTGGNTNTFTVSSTVGLSPNTLVTFTAGAGSIFGGVSASYNFYIYSVNPTINGVPTTNTIQVSQSLYGTVWPLVTATGTMTMNFSANNSYLQASTTNMVVNYPIQFTGTSIGGISIAKQYYIKDVIDSNNFTISTNLVTTTVTASTAGTIANLPNNYWSNTPPTLTGTTTSLIALSPVVFTNVLSSSGITDSQKYYISAIQGSNSFSIASSIISVTATATSANPVNLITVSSTAGFQVGYPIKFVGITFGGSNIVAESIYYISVINDSRTFTISQTNGGQAVQLTAGTGSMTVITCPQHTALVTASGTMTATATGAKTSVTLSTGGSAITGTFSTTLFGNVVLGTTYYINTIGAGNFTVSASLPVGTPLTLTTKTGAMNLAAVGWDHINVGSPISSSLDASSVYYIEPRITYSAPAFTQTNAYSPVTLAQGSTWNGMAYGNGYWIAVAGTSSTAAGSSDGSNWTSISMPSSQNWFGIAYGNGYWVTVSTSSSNVAAVSKSNGQGWITTTLPSSANWQYVAYGKGTFVALTSGQVGNTNAAAYSTDFGATWSATTMPASTNWISLTYGFGVFVAIAGGVGSTTAAWSLDGITWNASTLPANNWQSVTFGNNQFIAVAVANGGTTTAYSLDGLSWTASNLVVSANLVVYGNGIFLALPSSGSANAYTSEGAGQWRSQTVGNNQYGAVCFGYQASTNLGIFVTLGGTGTGTYISYGATAKGRPSVTSGTITQISEFEPGGGYATTPTVTFTDPNVTTLAVVVPRISQGVLGSPTWVSRGLGYNTTSTSVIVSGNGYADTYQTGLTVIINNLTRLPSPGDNLTITGVSQVYKVTSAYSVYNTVAPNLQANVSVSPAITTSNSTANGTTISIRSKYSQARLTNHDFLNIGYGDQLNSNYPGYPTAGYVALSQNQTVEVNYGRVFFTSTDQDGNFKVGNLFGVQQATGIITLSASQFGLSGLSSLSLGGISVGGSSTVITQFSSDATFTANSDSILPTQKSIKLYIASRLSQGGANTYTGDLIAGSVNVGSPNLLSSTIPNGNSGSVIRMGGVNPTGVNPTTTNKTYIAGPAGNNPPTLPNFGSYGGGGVDGQMAAMAWWMRNIFHK